MYILTRWALVLPLLILFYVILHVKKIKPQKWVNIIAVVTTCVLVSALCSVPLENLVYSFPTAEKAFCYYHSNFDEEDVIFSVEGDNSKLLIARSSKSSTKEILKKSGDKWKIGYFTDQKTIGKAFNGKVSVDIYEHKPTGDVYIRIASNSGEELNIRDYLNTDFKLCPPSDNTTVPLYFAYIPAYPESYEIVINGERFTFN